MNERGKFFNVDKSVSQKNDSDLRQKIDDANHRLATLAQVIGADFGMKVSFGELYGGSFFNPEENSITFDPQIILEGKEYQAEFIAGHEGGHRAITRTPEQIGMPRDKAVELYKKIGFAYLSNCLEDCADNNWVGAGFAKFQENCARFYAEQFSQENATMITPEISQLIAMLGYTPKFVSYGSEVIRRWANGGYSEKLDEAVAESLNKTESKAEEAWQTIPGVYAKERERLKKAKERFRIIYESLWPEFEKLVKADIDLEKLRQLADEINKQNAKKDETKRSGGAASSLPADMMKELSEKIEQSRREQIEKIDKEIKGLKDKEETADTEGEKAKLAGQLAKMIGDKDALENGDKVVVPWDKLSEDLKKKLQELFDQLPKEEKERLKEAAKKQLETLEDEINEEMRGKLSMPGSPPTHEEIRREEEKKLAAEDEAKERAAKRRHEEIKERELSAAIQAKLEGELGEYDKIYREIAPLADELHDRIAQIFLAKRHPRWEKGNPTGQRLDLAKVMQFQADRGLYDKLWERKTIPRKIDYKFTVLVDLSGSMGLGQKIDQTFRGVILLVEVLNRLGIKTEILGFQDQLIFYKRFGQELSSDIRKKMVVMLEEVKDKGEHNQANWNSDGYCLGEASKLLAEQRGKDNFLVVLSDGQPVPDQAHAGQEFDLSRVIGEVRKNTRQKLVGIGIGPGTEHVGQYYPTSLPSIELKKLPRTLGDLLDDMIRYPAKYH